MSAWRGKRALLLLASLLASWHAFVVAVAPAASATASAAASAAATVLGKVVRETTPVAGARVLAYASFADLLAFRAAAVSEPSGADGLCRLTVPPGSYYLVARGPQGTAERSVPVGGLHCYHGSNPFTLMPGPATEINFSLSRKSAEPAIEPAGDSRSGGILGTVTLEGRPVSGVQVALYLDAESGFRGSGYAVAPPTDNRGAFAFELLPESAYFVVARKRAAGGPGPLGEGDLYAYFVDNPVRVRNGVAVRVALDLVSKNRDVGNADGRPRLSGTRIAGRITDASGAVVPGVYAFAYEEQVMAHKRPAFISQPVDAEGRYVIHLSRSGTYYLGARSAYGDSPARGEWYGRYEGAPDHGVTVGTGTMLEGVDIRVERILQ